MTPSRCIRSLLNPFPSVPPPFPPQVYEGGSNVDQFVTRFLLKETANQIQSLLSSVESAVEAIEEQTSQIRCADGSELCQPAAWWGWACAWGLGSLGRAAASLLPPLPLLDNGDRTLQLTNLPTRSPGFRGGVSWEGTDLSIWEHRMPGAGSADKTEVQQ